MTHVTVNDFNILDYLSYLFDISYLYYLLYLSYLLNLYYQAPFFPSILRPYFPRSLEEKSLLFSPFALMKGSFLVY